MPLNTNWMSARLARRGGGRELRDHLARVHQQRIDDVVRLVLELRDRLVHPLLDADRLLLAPPPHLERLAAAVDRRRRRGLCGARRRGRGRRSGGLGGLGRRRRCRLAPLVAAAGGQDGRDAGCGEAAGGSAQEAAPREERLGQAIVVHRVSSFCCVRASDVRASGQLAPSSVSRMYQLAVRPQSTVTSMPVMAEASSEAR